MYSAFHASTTRALEALPVSTPSVAVQDDERQQMNDQDFAVDAEDLSDSDDSTNAYDDAAVDDDEDRLSSTPKRGRFASARAPQTVNLERLAQTLEDRVEDMTELEQLKRAPRNAETRLVIISTTSFAAALLQTSHTGSLFLPGEINVGGTSATLDDIHDLTLKHSYLHHALPQARKGVRSYHTPATLVFSAALVLRTACSLLAASSASFSLQLDNCKSVDDLSGLLVRSKRQLGALLPKVTASAFRRYVTGAATTNLVHRDARSNLAALRFIVDISEQLRRKGVSDDDFNDILRHSDQLPSTFVGFAYLSRARCDQCDDIDRLLDPLIDALPFITALVSSL